MRISRHFPSRSEPQKPKNLRREGMSVAYSPNVPLSTNSAGKERSSMCSLLQLLQDAVGCETVPGLCSSQSSSLCDLHRVGMRKCRPDATLKAKILPRVSSLRTGKQAVTAGTSMSTLLQQPSYTVRAPATYQRFPLVNFAIARENHLFLRQSHSQGRR
jgi:hypothetical protein